MSGCRDWEGQLDSVTFQSSSAEKGTYLNHREKSAASYAGLSHRLPPPLGCTAVERRRKRLEFLATDVGEDLAGPSECSRDTWPVTFLRELAAQLRGRGFAVMDSFLEREVGKELLAGIQDIRMKPWHEHIGNPASTKVIRGDEIALPDMEADTPFGFAMRSWLKKLDALVSALRLRLARPGELGRVHSREAPMATCYPPGPAEKKGAVASKKAK